MLDKRHLWDGGGLKKKNLIVALVDFCAVNMPTVVDLKIPTDCGQ